MSVPLGRLQVGLLLMNKRIQISFVRLPFYRFVTYIKSELLKWCIYSFLEKNHNTQNTHVSQVKVKVKVFLSLTKHQPMKKYGGVEVQLHTF